jgi:hypothetical protein
VVAETIIIMMPPCQDTSVNVKHDGSGRHRGKGPGEAAICPLSLKHFDVEMFLSFLSLPHPPNLRENRKNRPQGGE